MQGAGRECLVSAVAAGFLVLSACGGGGGGEHLSTSATNFDARTGTEEIEGARVLNNGELEQLLPIRYEPLLTPRLDELRTRENLDAAVAGASDEFERALLLKDWVAAQWPHSTPDPYPPWDAIIILDWIRAGTTGGFCGQYSQVLLQALASFGITARYVEIGLIDNPYAHFPIEVWSSRFGKWIVLDPDYNLHFENADGVPLSALEVHDALIEHRTEQLVVVEGSVREGHPSPSLWPLRTAELYYYYRVLLKADQLSVTDEPPFDRYYDSVELLDDQTVPWESSPVASPYTKIRLTEAQSGERAMFTNGPNRVRVTVDAIRDGEMLLRFANNVHDFDHYQLRMAGGDWIDQAESTFAWQPTQTARRLEVRGVNIRGVNGDNTAVIALFRARPVPDR